MALLSSNATGSKETALMEVDAQQTNFPPISGRPVAPVNIHTCRGRINSLPTVTGQQSPMERLGSKIEELAEFIKDKRNLHHELADCVEQPKCFLCTQEQKAPDSLCHIPGSGACKVFRTALAEATKGQK
ncbi:uncharacterized protein LOC123262225 [Cotesia glomerata]|uniref:uncharacterized protein LOC123262225 n=1 Tax=Cotesia glomerata TaxID=32391 RepID=UPI001D02AC08|nr:uncharacterized protein LOC123262225 [Cotesia glomerata]